jgi:hypothetical protein
MSSEPATQVEALEPCPGCGDVLPPVAGSAHAYIGASPACWARYNELLALEYSSPQLMRWHRLTVDSYTAQHPGVEGRRSSQSVWLHLIALCLALEHDLADARIRQVLGKLADGRSYAWLEPPPLATAPGVSDLLAASETAAYPGRVRAWAQAVWFAWAPHHEAIRREAAAALTSH